MGILKVIFDQPTKIFSLITTVTSKWTKNLCASPVIRVLGAHSLKGNEDGAEHRAPEFDEFGLC